MSNLELPPGWHCLSQQSARQFEEELQRELCYRHVFYRVPAQALALLDRRDDFLFRVPDNCFAQVHLTWQHEIDPSWPSTEMFSSLENWRTVIIEDKLDNHGY
jgi:hypothetical protein